MFFSKVTQVTEIARTAGAIIMAHRQRGVTAQFKANASPVTEADKDASAFIIDALKNLTPAIPVVSEEARQHQNLQAYRSPLRWVVDPLDGTRTFLEGYSEFGVLIGLVHNGKPIFGVAFYPALRTLFFTENGHAFKQIDGQEPGRIVLHNALQNGMPVAAVDWNAAKRPPHILNQAFEPISGVGGGRILLVAEGRADLAWMSLINGENFAQWDVAAPHAILIAAGGELVDLTTGRAVTYDNPDMTVPPAVAGHPDVLRQIGFRLDLSPKPVAEPGLSLEAS
jgi:3'(2'), 5'-bisphosphate nucleotidase